MRRFLSILYFPVFLISAYLFRLIWIDIIGTVITVFCNLFLGGSILKAVFLIITFPFVLLWEIFVGFYVCVLVAIDMCAEFSNSVGFATTIKRHLRHE